MCRSWNCHLDLELTSALCEPYTGSVLGRARCWRADLENLGCRVGGVLRCYCHGHLRSRLLSLWARRSGSPLLFDAGGHLIGPLKGPRGVCKGLPRVGRSRGTMLLTKESTRWLAKKGRREEALKSLIWVRGGDTPAVRDEYVQALHITLCLDE